LMKGKILLGITGSIACYKACELVRRFVKKNYEVKVVMTHHALSFIHPQTFQTLSGHPVYTELLSSTQREELLHIRLCEWGEVFLIAPATANIIGKMASGIADDLLSTLCLSFPGPIVVAPAMDAQMWENPVVKENVDKLKKRGVIFVGPEEGELASGRKGKGRLADLEKIIEAVEKVKKVRKDLEGKTILVTAGGTREYLDSFRYLTNPSSGKMGYALASAAWERGARVILITTPTLLEPLPVETIEVETALEMKKEVEKRFPSCDALLMSAAVCDWRPAKREEGKIKEKKGFSIHLVRNPDILKSLSSKKEGKVVVGFSAETEKEIDRAKKKLKEKNLDLIVANLIEKGISGFEADTNRGFLITKYGKIEEFPLISKKELAHLILDKVKELGGWK